MKNGHRQRYSPAGAQFLFTLLFHNNIYNSSRNVNLFYNIADKLIAKEEVELLYQFGNQIGLSDMEVATAIGEAIQVNYVPSLESIC